jgi:hypothetical protein
MNEVSDSLWGKEFRRNSKVEIFFRREMFQVEGTAHEELEGTAMVL